MNNEYDYKYVNNFNNKGNWRKKGDETTSEHINYDSNYNFNNQNNIKKNYYNNNNNDYNYGYKQNKYENFSNLTWKTRYSMNFCNHFSNNANFSEYNSNLKDHLNSLKTKSISFGNDQLTLYDNNWNEIDLYLKESLFTELNDLNKTLLNNLIAMEFKDLTPIQKAVYLPLKNGNNLIGCSKTGSGKTVAFLLPILNKMLNNGPPVIENQEKSKLSLMNYRSKLSCYINFGAHKRASRTNL